MEKTIVITYFFALYEVRYYLFDDYILRENSFHHESLRDVNGIAFQLLDFRTKMVHTVPFDRKVRSMAPYLPVEGEWKFAGREIIRTASEKVSFSHHPCLKITEYCSTQSPFDSGEFTSVKYYANLDSRIGKYKPLGYMFMGFKNFSNDPYICLIKHESIHPENQISTIFRVEIDHQHIDRSILNSLLELPLVREEEVKGG